MAGATKGWSNDRGLVAWLAEQRDSRLQDWDPRRGTGRPNFREHVRIERRMTEGGYRRRQLLELLQNAVDAALPDRASRITVVREGSHLYVANQGEPLSRAGIETLLTSHDSSKSGSIGKFGLGFKSLLGLGDTVEIFSRGISIVFDRCRSETAIREQHPAYATDDVPVMRLAWETSCADEARRDATLRELVKGHDTVIRVRLRDDEAREALEEEVEQLQYEFLLFARRDIQLTCCGRRAAVQQDGTTERRLVVDDTETSWNVVEQVVDLPKTRGVEQDAGQLHSTERLPITWAVPAEGRSAGHFWAFFPLTENARIPGIINAPFKTNDDRSSLADGPFNRALLALCAQLVVTHLPDLRSKTARARHLDYLPRRDGGGPLAEQFAAEIWTRARAARLGPNARGRLALPKTLYTPPDADPEVLEGWTRLASEEVRAGWAHADACRTRDRRGRWMELCEAKAPAPVEEWVQAVCRSDPDGAAEVLAWIATLLKEDASRKRFDGKTWRVVLDREGKLRVGAELLLLGGEDEACVHPQLVGNERLRAVLSDLGVREKDASWFHEGMTAAARAENWERFWTLWREAPPAAREGHSLVKFRTRAGTWRRSSDLVVPGGVIPVPTLGHGLSSDQVVPQYLVDEAAHTPGERGHFEIDERPTWQTVHGWWTSGSIVREWYGEALARWSRQHPGKKGKKPEPLHSFSFCAVIDLLKCDDDYELRGSLTRVFQATALSTTTFGFAKDSWETTNAVAYALIKYGLFGDMSFEEWNLIRVGTKLVYWIGASTSAEFLAGVNAADIVLSDKRRSELCKDFEYRLDPSELDRVSPTERVEIYCDAARFGIFPQTYIVGEERIPRSGLRISDKEMEEPGVLVVPSEAIPHFERAGVRRWEPEPLSAEEALLGEPRDATEVFPWMEPLLKDEVDATVQRSLSLEKAGAAPRAHANLDSGRMEIWCPGGEVPSEHEVLVAAGELGWLRLPALEALETIEVAVQGQAEAQARAVTGSSLEERLLHLVGREALRRHTGIAHVLDADDIDDVCVARVFLAQHGCLALRDLRAELEARRLNPPRRWGTEAASVFAESLGFPPEFGGAANQRRDRQEVVEGPPLRSLLHDFQEEAVAELQSVVMSKGKRAMFSLPTGAGKTRVTVEALVRGVLRRGEGDRYVLWIAQQDELCEQAVDTFKRIWRQEGTPEALTIHRVWAGNRPRCAAGPQVVVATIQTIVGRGGDAAYQWLRSPAAVVIDEAHHAIAPSYFSLLRLLDTEGAKRRMPLIGLSATPHRRDSTSEESRRLVGRFDKVLIPSLERQWELQEELETRGILARAVHRLLELPFNEQLTDAEQVHVKTYGEFPPSVGERLALNEERNDLILERVTLHLEENDAARVLLFSASVNHARRLAAALALRGVSAASVDGGTPTTLRRYFLREFGAGRIRVMVNCGVLTTGFDEPKVTAVIVARPTLSPVLYQQMIGRGLRGPANGGTESCEIITIADNFQRFGLKVSLEWFEDCWGDAERILVGPRSAP
jgi:superfamily II DNA or RNA helicase